MKSDTSRVPEGWLGLDVEGVYVKGNQLVVVGEPDEQIEHNCDAMGCGSLDHVLFRCTLPKWHAVEHTLAPDGAVCPAHQTYFEEDGTCAIAGCKETRPAGKA